MSKNIISGQHNGFDFVEIAGIKWATCNVGAEKPTDTGLYFQWGVRKGYTADEVGKVKMFNLKHYKLYNDNRYTKYNEFDSKITIDLCDDAAFAYMGHGWRMPTSEDFRRLYVNTIHWWANNYHRSGVAGMVFTDITDESKELFFPAVGYCDSGGVGYVGFHGFYWSGSLDSIGALGLDFNNDGPNWRSTWSRCIGSPIRGILTV